jgi:hypothetical protein
MILPFGCAGLWIEVEEQGVLAGSGESCRKVDRERRFSDPALLRNESHCLHLDILALPYAQS